MAHVPFNHFDATAFNNFVPEATKTSRNNAFQTILIIGGACNWNLGNLQSRTNTSRARNNKKTIVILHQSYCPTLMDCDKKSTLK